MITDKPIQILTPGFNLPSKVPIGGVDPLSALTMPVGTSRFFWINGSTDPTGYAQAEWYWTRPQLTNSGHFRLTERFRLNGPYPANWQGKELDCKLVCADGKTRNFSFLLQPWNGKFSVSQQDGTWFEQGTFGPLDPTKPHTLELDYLYNSTGTDYSSALPTLDGIPLATVRAFMNLEATDDNWPKGFVTVQDQLCQTLEAAGIAYECDDLRLDWF